MPLTLIIETNRLLRYMRLALAWCSSH